MALNWDTCALLVLKNENIWAVGLEEIYIVQITTVPLALVSSYATVEFIFLIINMYSFRCFRGAIVTATAVDVLSEFGSTVESWTKGLISELTK